MRRDYAEICRQRGFPTRRESQPAFTSIKHAWRGLHRTRHLEFLTWLLPDLDERQAVELLQVIAARFGRPRPKSLPWRGQPTARNIAKAARGLAADLDAGPAVQDIAHGADELAEALNIHPADQTHTEGPQ